MKDSRYTLYLARCWQEDIDKLGFGASNSEASSKSDENQFADFVSNRELRKKTKKLFMDGHYARAVEEAYKYIDNLVKRKTGKVCKNASGAKLMREAFSPNKPILKINDFTTESERDAQQGYMEILAGCMMGIRNPRAHDSDLEDEKETALRLLGFADHLACLVNQAKN